MCGDEYVVIKLEYLHVSVDRWVFSKVSGWCEVYEGWPLTVNGGFIARLELGSREAGGGGEKLSPGGWGGGLCWSEVAY
jgi:hypothetical protein